MLGWDQPRETGERQAGCLRVWLVVSVCGQAPVPVAAEQSLLGARVPGRDCAWRFRPQVDEPRKPAHFWCLVALPRAHLSPGFRICHQFWDLGSRVGGQGFPKQ